VRWSLAIRVVLEAEMTMWLCVKEASRSRSRERRLTGPITLIRWRISRALIIIIVIINIIILIFAIFLLDLHSGAFEQCSQNLCFRLVDFFLSISKDHDSVIGVKNDDLVSSFSAGDEDSIRSIAPLENF
jgi:hypothetical protein